MYVQTSKMTWHEEFWNSALFSIVCCLLYTLSNSQNPFKGNKFIYHSLRTLGPPFISRQNRPLSSIFWTQFSLREQNEGKLMLSFLTASRDFPKWTKLFIEPVKKLGETKWKTRKAGNRLLSKSYANLPFLLLMKSYSSGSLQNWQRFRQLEGLDKHSINVLI